MGLFLTLWSACWQIVQCQSVASKGLFFILLQSCLQESCHLSASLTLTHMAVCLDDHVEVFMGRQKSSRFKPL